MNVAVEFRQSMIHATQFIIIHKLLQNITSKVLIVDSNLIDKNIYFLWEQPSFFFYGIILQQKNINFESNKILLKQQSIQNLSHSHSFSKQSKNSQGIFIFLVNFTILGSRTMNSFNILFRFRRFLVDIFECTESFQQSKYYHICLIVVFDFIGFLSLKCSDRQQVNSSDFGPFRALSYPIDKDFSPLEELPNAIKFSHQTSSKGVIAEQESLIKNTEALFLMLRSLKRCQKFWVIKAYLYLILKQKSPPCPVKQMKQGQSSSFNFLKLRVCGGYFMTIRLAKDSALRVSYLQSSSKFLLRLQYSPSRKEIDPCIGFFQQQPTFSGKSKLTL